MNQPPPPVYDVQGNQTLVGVQNPTSTSRPHRASLHMTGAAAGLSIACMYGNVMALWGLSDFFDVDLFSDEMQIVELALGGVGCLCLILCFISKFCKRKDVSLTLSFVGTLLSAGFLGITVYTWLEAGWTIEDLFVHGQWPFYVSIAVVVVGFIATILNFLEFQQPSQVQDQSMQVIRSPN
ncbi:hypothetical protein ACF0H5_022859 [Mactra antiquata]